MIITFSASPPPIFASLSNKEGVSTVPFVCKIKIIKSYLPYSHPHSLPPSLHSPPHSSALALIPTFGITVEPLYSGHPWDKYKCPEYRRVLISGVNLYYKAQFGTFVSVLNTGVSSFQGVLNRRVSLQCYIMNFLLCVYD